MASTGTLIFETVVVDFLKVIPEIPVVETWSWLTNVIKSHDGTEQRISLREQPRRRIEYTILLEDDVERQREYRRWFQYLSGKVIAPYYQYHTKIVTKSIIGGSKIFFDRDKTDFRDDDFAVIFRGSTEESFLIPLTTIDADGGNTATSLSQDILIGDIVAPAFESFIDNSTGPQMATVSGTLNFKLNTIEARSQFDRPESVASITVFDSLNVMDHKVIVRQLADEVFDIRPTVYENDTGITDRTSALLHAIISGRRQFHIPRRTNFTEMDFWRDFLTALVGMREPFLLPTWREDLFLKTNPNPGDPSILIEGADYGSQYFQHDTYKRLQFLNPSDEIAYRKVISVTPQAGGDTLLSLDTPVTNDPLWANGFEISFLNKVRLAADDVSFNHFAVYSILSLSVVNTDQ